MAGKIEHLRLKIINKKSGGRKFRLLGGQKAILSTAYSNEKITRWKSQNQQKIPENYFQIVTWFLTHRGNDPFSKFTLQHSAQF